VDKRVGELWAQYRRTIGGLYGPYQAIRPSVEQSLAELDLVLALSEAMEAACVVETEAGDADESNTALLAVAAVEATVAAEIIAAASEGQPDSEIEVEVRELLRSVEGSLVPEETPPLSAWLAEADVAFGAATEIGGGAPVAGYRNLCGSRIEELVEQARSPAAGFALGSVTFGAAELFALFGQVEVLRHLAESVADVLHKGFLLLQRAIRKLIRGLGGSLPLAIILECAALGGLMEWVQERPKELETPVLRRAVDARQAEAELDTIAAELEGLGGGQGAILTDDLDRLCRRYRRQMKCAKRVRTGLRLAAPALAGSGGGLPLVAGLNTAALAYVLYSLAARLDTAPALMVRGVPSLARAAIGPPTGPRHKRWRI
jgi:hypothetical protein